MSINYSVVRDGDFDYVTTENLDVSINARIASLEVSGSTSTKTLVSTGNANLASLTVGTLIYPSSGPAMAVPISTGSKLTFLSRVIANSIGTLAGVGDHVQFTTPLLQVGNNITIDTTSPYTAALNVPSFGRITLKPGTYHVRAAVLEAGTVGGVNGTNMAVLRNADTGAYFTPVGSLAAGSDRMFLSDETIITVAIQTRLDFTFANATTLSSYGKAVIEVSQLA